MKKIYLIHGWGGNSSSEAWFPWLKEECSKRNFELVIFDMPNTDEPVIEEWIGFLKKNVKEVNPEDYFIGHSVGCQAVLRYLEILNSEVKISGCVFIAPWMELDRNTIEEEGEEVVEIAKPWMETPINFEKIKKHTKKFLCILSDDDPYVPLSNKEFFEKKLGAKVIIKKREEHFNETKKIPEIIEFLE
ncbi:MAG: alpha/beta hydrolase [Nanoarchaeota archaeon]|nr:alpha/beta hydrolase [Nanoarchaeota archaeon]